MSTVVACEDLYFAYGATDVLCGLRCTVRAGEFVALIGANGSGKSTLMRILLGLLRPTSGTVAVLGQEPLAAVRSGEVGYVPQRDSFARHSPLAVRDVVMLGRCARIGLGRRPAAGDHDAVDEALACVGASELGSRCFGELSGGQQRLVTVARALAQQPRLLLLDEADTGLDEARRTRVYDLLNGVRQGRDLAIVAISHQFETLSHVVDEAIALRDGTAVAWCPEHMTHPLASHAESRR